MYNKPSRSKIFKLPNMKRKHTNRQYHNVRYDIESYNKALLEFANSADRSIKVDSDHDYIGIEIENIDIQNNECTIRDEFDWHINFFENKRVDFNMDVTEIGKNYYRVDKINYIYMHDTLKDKLINLLYKIKRYPSPSRRRYEHVIPNLIGITDYLPNHEIAFYCDGNSLCKIKKPARVMIHISYNIFVTVCVTKHFVFPLFPWNWVFNIKHELDFITKYRNIIFKYWNNEGIYGNETAHILMLMIENHMTEEEAVIQTKKDFFYDD